MAMVFCRGCAKEIHESAVSCPACGAPQAAHGHGGGARGGKSRTTAGILALLLGGVGVHKFYLGQTGMGILYLVFCLTGIPALVALVEGILYLTKTDQEFAAKYA